MTRMTTRRCMRTAHAGALSLLLCSSAVSAQGGSPGPQAAALPLSGKTGVAGSALATQTALPGGTSGVNTVSPTVQVQGPLAGSRPAGALAALAGPLGLREAVRRGLEYNLGSVSVSQMVQQAHGQRRIARSALLPNLTSDLTAAVRQINLAAQGFEFGGSFQGFEIPDVVGPFHFVDFRGRLSQTVFDLTSLNNYRAARETARAAELSADDARDLVVLAVGGTYLQVQAARERVEAARTQVETANALYEQAAQRRAVGLLAQVDVDRSQIQSLTQQQRLAVLQSDLAKQKIKLVRMIGLGATDQYDLAEAVPYAPMAELVLDDALRQATENRRDLQAADAQLRAARRALAATRSERLPTVTVNADYGAIGRNPSEARRTFSVVGRVRTDLGGWSDRGARGTGRGRGGAASRGA